MTRRISLDASFDPEPENPLSEMAELPPEASHSKHQEHIDTLVRGGIVTHQISNPSALDPLFAVAQINDLPEVRFVAAFEDGLVILGCPEGLPDPLKDLAEPLEVLDDRESEATNDTAPRLLTKILEHIDGLNSSGEISAGLQKIDRISQRLEYVHDALPNLGQETGQEHLTSLVQKLDERIEALSNNTDVTDLRRALATIDEAARSESEAFQAKLGQTNAMLQEVATGVKLFSSAEGDSTAETDALTRIEAALSDIRIQMQEAASSSAPGASSPVYDMEEVIAKIDARIENILEVQLAASSAGPELSPLQDDLATVNEKLDASHRSAEDHTQTLNKIQDQLVKLAEGPSVEIDLTEQRRAFAQFGSVMSMIVRRTEAAARDIVQTKLTTTEDTQKEMLQAIPQKIEELSNEVSDARNALAQAADIKTELDGIRDAISEAKRSEPDAVAKGGIEAVQAALEGLQSDLAALVNKPKQTFDVAEQRRSFAAFTTALSTIIKRLEGTAEKIAENTSSQDAGAHIDEIRDLLCALPEQVHAALPNPPDLSGIEQKLGDLKRSEAMLMAPLKAVSEKVEAFSDRTEEHLGGVAEQLAALNSGLAEQSAGNIAPFETLTTRLQELTTVARTEFAGRMDELTEGLERLATSQTDDSSTNETLQSLAAALPALDTLGCQITTLMQRPDPAIDLTAQRQSFAQFATAMSTAISRLERLSGEMIAQDSSGDVAASLGIIRKELEALPATEIDLSPVLQRLNEIATAPDATLPILADIQSRLEILGNTPTPAMDLTAQRQSFAKFGTALNATISRLEAISAQIEVCGPQAESQAKEIAAVMQALPVLLENSLNQAMNPRPVQESIANLESKISALPEEIGMNGLRDSIAAVANRADPLIDLSGQRQSIARFGTAMASVVRRLEDVARAMDCHPDPPEPDLSPLFDRIESMDDRIESFAGDQAEQTSTLAEHLSSISSQIEKLRRASHTPAPSSLLPQSVPENHISLEDMRLHFAELIATQIKANAEQAI